MGFDVFFDALDAKSIFLWCKTCKTLGYLLSTHINHYYSTHYYPLLPIITHYYPWLPIIISMINYYPLWSIVNHYQLLLTMPGGSKYLNSLARQKAGWSFGQRYHGNFAQMYIRYRTYVHVYAYITHIYIYNKYIYI